MRVILHPGFHKTGTSTLQACLAANRAALAPFARIMLEAELSIPLRHATRFSLDRDPLTLASFAASFGECCLTLAKEHPQTLLISCEGLSGRTPGKNGIIDYRAAPPLARAVRDAVRAVFGRKTDITLIYTTRNAADWLYSAWRHNLLGYRVTEDFAAFRQTYLESADFSTILTRIAADLPQVTLVQASLQVNTHPAAPVLNLLNLPDSLTKSLGYPAARNVGPAKDLCASLLALNRSDLPDAELKRRKLALLTPNAT